MTEHITERMTWSDGVECGVFGAELPESVPQMKRGEAARTTPVKSPEAAAARATLLPKFIRQGPAGCG
jgi:hypothetical protein